MTDWTNGVRVYLAFFTPEECASLLERNTGNRDMNRRTIRSIRKALRSGEMYLSDSAITIAPDGTLTNGQNRCQAAVEEGVGFWAIRAEGVPKAAQLIMDTGSRRTFAQHLKIAYGEGDTINKAAITSGLWKYTNGHYTFRGNYFNRPDPSVIDLDSTWRTNRGEILAAVTVGRRASQHTEFTLTPLGIAAIVTSRIDSADSEFFFDRLATGSGLPEGSPILAARAWSITSARSVSGKPSASHQLAIIFKAWNAFRDGRSVKAMSYRPGGAAPEQFPTPR